MLKYVYIIYICIYIDLSSSVLFLNVVLTFNNDTENVSAFYSIYFTCNFVAIVQS